MQLDKPMFKSLSGALLWTFSSSRVPFGMIAVMPLAGNNKTDQLDDPNKKASPSRDERLDDRPRGFDRLAQSGMIQSALKTLKPQHRAALTAIYSSGRTRIAAQREIREFVIPRMTATIRRHHRRLIYELVAAAFGKPVKFQSLAIKFHIHPNTITRKAREVDTIIMQVVSDAVNEGTDLLKEQGVIL